MTISFGYFSSCDLRLLHARQAKLNFRINVYNKILVVTCSAGKVRNFPGNLKCKNAFTKY